LQSGAISPSTSQWLQATFVTGQKSPSQGGHIPSMSMHALKMLELERSSRLELDSVSGKELELSATSELLSGAVSLEAGSSLPEDFASELSTAEDFSSPPTGALGLSSSQAANMNAARATAAMLHVDFKSFLFIPFSFFLLNICSILFQIYNPFLRKAIVYKTKSRKFNQNHKLFVYFTYFISICNSRFICRPDTKAREIDAGLSRNARFF
jgi:hypothetical protein